MDRFLSTPPPRIALAIWRKGAPDRTIGDTPTSETVGAKKMIVGKKPAGPAGQTSPLGRREFLKASALSAAGLLLPEAILADPYRPFLPRFLTEPIRIRGRVTSGTQGIGGVAVSDGWDVVSTAGDGTFELVSTADRDYLRMSIPSGFRVPQSPTGTAQAYRPISPDSSGEMNASFELAPLEGSDENHTALILADIQTENAQEMAWFHEHTVPDVQQTLRGLSNPEAIGIADGDIMYDHLELYPEFERGVQRLGIPFFQVVGNHDLNQDSGTDVNSARTFSSFFGPRYYSFNRGAVHYVVLDDVFWHGSGYLGYVGSDQLRWLENDLEMVEPGRPGGKSGWFPRLVLTGVDAGSEARRDRDRPGRRSSAPGSPGPCTCQAPRLLPGG